MHGPMLNKRRVTLPTVNFASEVVFWAFLKDFKFTAVPLNRRTRVNQFFERLQSQSESPLPPPPKKKIALLRFQTMQQKSRKIHNSSRTFRSKIHPKVLEPSKKINIPWPKCVARFKRASQDWTVEAISKAFVYSLKTRQRLSLQNVLF